FAGVTGWTAPPILAAVEAAGDLDLVAGVSRSAAGRGLAEITGTGNPGQVYGTVAEALDATRPDVLVDFTSAQAVRGHGWAAGAACSSTCPAPGASAGTGGRRSRRACTPWSAPAA